jgi:pimeloyl-ACP methyl ester carboxylesterase
MRIDVPQAALDDLARRLEHARLPEGRVLDGGEDATRLDRIARLFERWRGGYDWRAAEARINEYEQTLVNGLHVLRAGRGPKLVLMNGWPSTFAEYLPALPLLDGFEVAIVSRAGYGFSDHGLDRPGDDEHAAEDVGRVLDALGWERFAAHGDDFGGSVLSRLALQRPVAALHVCEWLEDLAAPGLTPAERDYVDGVNRWREAERGYGHVQANRPQTLGMALDDSPFGLLAWIADKWLSWSDPACELDDVILTTATIYWVTRTIAPSMRAYAADAPAPAEKVAVPTHVTVGKEERPPPPREWLERSYADLRSLHVLERGGHFWAAETPGAFAERLSSVLDDAQL